MNMHNVLLSIARKHIQEKMNPEYKGRYVVTFNLYHLFVSVKEDHWYNNPSGANEIYSTFTYDEWEKNGFNWMKELLQKEE